LDKYFYRNTAFFEFTHGRFILLDLKNLKL
jgi:hypothetical protein